MEKKEIKEVGRDVAENSDAVTREWNRLLSTHRRTRSTLSERVDHLPQVISGIADAALCRPGVEDARDSMALHALVHGEDRRAQGWSEQSLLEDFYLVRLAIANYLSTKQYDETQVVGALLRVDAAVTDAIQATLRGYHGRDFEGLKI